MAYPLMENLIGNSYFYDNTIYSSSDRMTDILKSPTDDVTYYETVRIKDGILLFLESHLDRLKKSVKGIEDFYVDTDNIEKSSYSFLKSEGYGDYNGNLRIVLTNKHLLIHICEANIPSDELFANGINTMILNWERVDPNLKVFRGDYKKAVADTFAISNEFGFPYEVLLTDSNNKLYEGSKSNLFVIIGNDIYSAPDDKILIGITRNRVMASLEAAGGKLVTGTFTLDEIVKLSQERPGEVAVFVSSTPFDILPIRYINGFEINSAENSMLQKISKSYINDTVNYMNKVRTKL